jgi:hypothetical protein
MSMYNALFGVNPLSGVLLGMLGGKPSDVGRFRDTYVTEQDGQPVIAVYTRNGGGNRDHYDDESESGPECSCTGCTMKHPWLVISGTSDDSTALRTASAQLEGQGSPETGVSSSRRSWILRPTPRRATQARGGPHRQAGAGTAQGRIQADAQAEPAPERRDQPCRDLARMLDVRRVPRGLSCWVR